MQQGWPDARDDDLTVSLTEDVKRRLDRLADRTHRSTSRIAANAITAFVEHESAIIEGIERGLSDMRVGRVVAHAEAMNRLEATIGSSEPHEV